MIDNAFTCSGAYAVLIMSGLKRVENRSAMPVPARGRCAGTPFVTQQGFSVEMYLDIDYHSQRVHCINVSGVNAGAFGSIVSNVPPAWLWRREWNMMRAT